jgi:hypothetical protein
MPYSVLPLQTLCGQVQLTSGVFSIASHSALQYFPSVIWQLQTGCAHFLGDIALISSDRDFETGTVRITGVSTLAHTAMSVLGNRLQAAHQE